MFETFALSRLFPFLHHRGTEKDEIAQRKKRKIPDGIAKVTINKVILGT